MFKMGVQKGVRGLGWVGLGWVGLGPGIVDPFSLYLILTNLVRGIGLKVS